MRRVIKIKYQNGINQEIAVKEILNEVIDIFDFVESEDPDFILFGPYGIDVPEKGNYIRIGYFCENIVPDFDSCEWSFGVQREEEYNIPTYKRIQWHGLDPECMVKRFSENEIDRIISSNRKFCNFLYSNPVFYREEFFRQLSKYKKIDAPGRSMNNMPSIDTIYQGDIWERKRKFLQSYKFTIAFENYCYPGYQTEKLYDAMQMNSLPIYCGDPYIGEVFNTFSFVHARDYVEVKRSQSLKLLEKIAQPNFKVDAQPSAHKRLDQKIVRKLKKWGRELKMKWEFNHLNYEPLIERIIELDKDDTLYAKYLREPWFNNNTPPGSASSKERWIKIFSGNE